MVMRTFRHLIAIVPLAAFTACATPAEETWDEDLADAEERDDVGEPDGEDGIEDAALNLVAIANTPRGNQLRFYEPMPGHILTVELGTGFTMPDMDDAVALFEAAAPGVAVPAALIEAQTRAVEMSADDASADERPAVARLSVPQDQAVDRAPERDPAVALAAGPCEINTFIQNECTEGSQEWCKINWANGFYAYNTSAWYMRNSVCSLTGKVTLTLVINSVPKASYDVVKGAIGRVVWQNFSNQFGFHTQVTNASGDHFHVGGSSF